MSQYTKNILTAPTIFNINDSNRTLVQSVKNQENPSNSQNTVHMPKIKLKDLKELQDPKIVSNSEREKWISDPFCNFYNNNADCPLVYRKDLIFPTTDQNCKNYQSQSYDQKTFHPQTDRNKLAHHQLDIWINERLNRESLKRLEKKQELIEKMREKTRYLLQNNQTYSFSKPDINRSPNRNQNPILGGRDNQNIDMTRCINNSLPISQTSASNLPNTLNGTGTNPADATINVGGDNDNHTAQNCFEFICMGESSYVEVGTNITPNPVVRSSTSCTKSVQNSKPKHCGTDYESRQIAKLNCDMKRLHDYPIINSSKKQPQYYGSTNTASLNYNANQDHERRETVLQNYNANQSQDHERSKTVVLNSNANQLQDYERRKTVLMNYNADQSQGYESREIAHLNYNANQSQDQEKSKSVLLNTNVNQSQDHLRRKTVLMNYNADQSQDYESRKPACLNSNVNQSQDCESRQTVGSNSKANQPKDHAIRQSEGMMFKDNKSQDYEVRQTAGLNSDLNQSHMPSIDVLDLVDSTGLRSGIINASRTLISTEKLLKSLLKTLSHTKTLPQKQALSLSRRFQSISKTFNEGFDEIDKNVTKEYKHLFSDSVVKEQEINELLENGKQDNEIIPKQNKNDAEVGIGNEQQNSFINGNKLQELNTEQKTNTICRKRRRRKTSKSDDEELDESFQPAPQARDIMCSTRNVPQRSCRKRHIPFSYEAENIIFY